MPAPRTRLEKTAALSVFGDGTYRCGNCGEPGLLDSLLLANGGYNWCKDGQWGCVDFDRAVRSVDKATGTANLIFKDVDSRSTQTLDSLLREGHQVIVAVAAPGQKTVGTHYVLVTGKQNDGSYTIDDPGYPSNKTLDAYNNVFETRGYVTDPSNLGDIDISAAAVGSGVNVLLTDSYGNKTGIDGAGQRSELIPNSVHFVRTES